MPELVGITRKAGPFVIRETTDDSSNVLLQIETKEGVVVDRFLKDSGWELSEGGGGGGVTPFDTNLRYVDATNGSDAANGLTAWTPKQTLQAAYNSLPATGGMLICAPGVYDTVGGFTGTATKPAVITSFTGHRSYRYPPYSPGAELGSDVWIKASAPTSDAIITVTNTTSGPAPGWEFHGFYLDCRNVDFGIKLTNITYPVFEDIGGSDVQTPTSATYLVRADVDNAIGYADASWGRMNNCNTNRVGLLAGGVDPGDPVQNFNDWQISQCVGFPGPYAHFIRIVGAHRCKIEATAEPGPNSPSPFYLESCFQCDVKFAAGEGTSAANTHYLYATSCEACIWEPSGISVPSSTDRLIFDNGVSNTIRATTVSPSGKYDGLESKRVEIQGAAPGPTVLGSGFGYPSLARIPVPGVNTHQMLGPELPRLARHDNLTMEYWDGAAWQAWAPTNIEDLPYPNRSQVTVDSTHLKFRITVDGMPTTVQDAPIVQLHYQPPTLVAVPTITVLVEGLDGSNNVTQAGYTSTLRINSTVNTITVPGPTLAGQKIRVTIDFSNARSSGNALLTYFQVYSQGGLSKKLIGGLDLGACAGSPEGVITAAVGSTIRDITNGVLYIKVTGTAKTGWTTIGGIAATIGDAKGDMIGFSAADTPIRVPIGTNTHVATADSTAAAGWKWAATPSGIVTLVPRTTDSAAKTDNTLANDDTLLWAISGDGNDIWFFEAFLDFNAANATMDVKLGFAVPAGTTMRWGAGYSAGSSAFPGFYALAAASTPVTPFTESSTPSWGVAALTHNLIGVSGFVYVGGTAGNVVLQWAQNTTDAGNLILNKGSFLRLSQIV